VTPSPGGAIIEAIDVTALGANMPAAMSHDSHRKVSRPRCPGPDVAVDEAGVWHVHGFRPSRAALRSTDTRQGGFGVENAERLGHRMRAPVLWRDGAEHREHRRQTARFFTPRRVHDSYGELMRRCADAQCARLSRRGQAGLSSLTFPLAVRVTGEIIGLTAGRPGMARRLNRFFFEGRAQPGWGSPAAIHRMLVTNAYLAAFYGLDVRPAVRARRRQRRDDLISHLLDEGCKGPEVLGECLTFAAAGMITTREFITAVTWHLFDDPGLRAAYVDGGDARRLSILHEVLRLEPVVGNLYRWTTAELSLPLGSERVTIPAGARLDVDIATANLDPAVMSAEPERICPARPLSDGAQETGLAFGDGPHRCPGSHVALQLTDIFVSKLFALPNLRMVRPPRIRLRHQIASYELNGMIVATDRTVPGVSRGLSR
jgi:cytochrome P450